jgi:hypothetical protein
VDAAATLLENRRNLSVPLFVTRDINADPMRILNRHVTSRMQHPGDATCDCPMLTALLNCGPRSSVVKSKRSKQRVEEGDFVDFLASPESKEMSATSL